MNIGYEGGTKYEENTCWHVSAQMDLKIGYLYSLV